MRFLVDGFLGRDSGDFFLLKRFVPMPIDAIVLRLRVETIVIQGCVEVVVGVEDATQLFVADLRRW